MAVPNASPLRVLAGRSTCLPRVSRGPPYLFHKSRREFYFVHVENPPFRKTYASRGLQRFRGHTMKSFIQDLFGHQEWADAELWKAVEACPGALDQEDISKRFRHFHSTQYAYHLLLRGEKADVRSFISRYGDSVPIQTVKPNSTRLREVGGTPPHNRLRPLDMERATEGRVVKRQ